MTRHHRSSFILIALTSLLAGVVATSAQAPQPGAVPATPAQGAAAVPAGGGRGGGRGGGLPGATPEQTQAVAAMTAALADLTTALTAARNELATVTFADTRNDAAIKSAVEKVRAAELALASKRADEFANLQAGPNRLNAEQIAALVAAGGSVVPAGGRGGGGAGGGARGAAPAAGAAGGRGVVPPGRGN